MAYNITTTSGLSTFTITNGAINTQTNLSFIGKGALNYGSNLNTNFLRLLENFADNAEPSKPIIGQIWWDTSTNNLRVYDGVTFGIVSPPLGRITSSTIGNLIISTSSITGEIVDGNVNIGPNGTGTTVINRLAIKNAEVGKVPYTAANGMVVTSTLSFNSTDNTLTATNLSATNIAGTLTTGAQPGITSVGTLNSLTVSGNVVTTGSGQLVGYFTGVIGANTANSGVFTSVTTANGGQVSGYITGAIGANTANTGTFTSVTTTSGGELSGYHTGAIGANVANTGVFTSMIGNSFSLSSSSPSLFTMTSSSTNGGLKANLITTGTSSLAVPLLIFSRTNTSTTVYNGGLGWIKTLTDGSTVTSSIYVNGTNTASSPSTVMTFYSPNGFSFTGTSGTTTIDTNGNVGVGGISAGSAGYRFALQGYETSSVPLYLHSDATNAYLYSPNPVYLGSTGANLTTLVTNNTSRLSINSSGYVGIGGVNGVISPSYPLHVITPQEWGIALRHSSATTTSRATVLTQKSLGTDSSPTTVTNGTIIGGISSGGYDGTSWGAVGYNGGTEILSFAAETWTPTARGSYMTFGTTATGAAAVTERMRIESTGNVSITGNTTISGTITASGPASSAPLALTDGATITPNFALRNNFSVTLGGNRTLANPGNITVGQSGIIYISQDATGSRTLSYGTYWKFPSGVAPTLTATANATDALVYFVRTATSITVSYLLNIG
jgi:hypothetical protein